MSNRLYKSIMIVLFTMLLVGCGSKGPLEDDIALEVTMEGVDAEISEDVAIGTLLSRSITLDNVTVPLSEVRIRLTGVGSEDFNVSVEPGSSANSYLGKIVLLHSLEGKGGEVYDLNATASLNGETFGPVSVKIQIIDIPQWTIVSLCDETNGTEVWITDGTEAGTKPLGNFNPEGESYLYSLPAKLGDKVYFSMNIDDGKGATLWESNGTREGTMMLKDINSSHDSERVHDIVTAGDKIFFSVNEKQLWMSDGTEAGTVMLKDINAYRIYDFTTYHDKVYFIAVEAELESIGDTISLWESDGTAEGTKMTAILSEISNKPKGLAFVGDTLYFTTQERDILKIHKADIRQTPLVVEDDDTIPNSGLRWMGLYKDNLHLITIDNTTSHSSIWKRAEDGYTKLPLDIAFDFGNIQLFDGLFLFNTFDSDEMGDHYMQLWKSDTTEDGSSVVKQSICPLY